MSEPTITLAEADPDDLSTDAIVVFSDEANARENVWLTLDMGIDRPTYSLNIVKTDEGIVLDLYLCDKEDMGTVATTYAFDQDAHDFEDGHADRVFEALSNLFAKTDGDA